jgi:hypothetical protein
VSLALEVGAGAEVGEEDDDVDKMMEETMDDADKAGAAAAEAEEAEGAAEFGDDIKEMDPDADDEPDGSKGGRAWRI